MSEMTKAGRGLTVLKFMGEHRLALPLAAIFENLKREVGITFSERTTQRRLAELVELGFLEKLELRSGYYRITDRGEGFLESDPDEEDLGALLDNL